jgi:hypothetical protein
MNTSTEILSIFDTCASNFTFPMLDNGYFYLAASRLTLFRSSEDWALVIETFGFSPRAGLPYIAVDTFANTLRNRNEPSNYVTQAAYEQYLANNPNNETRYVYPIDEGEWQDKDCGEYVVAESAGVKLRDTLIPIPSCEECGKLGISTLEKGRLHVFELCRFLAETSREKVLATIRERRVSVTPEQKRILQLESWRHPDLVAGELPSQTETFQQLALVAETGDLWHYRPSQPPNSHWSNWPEGGSL